MNSGSGGDGDGAHPSTGARHLCRRDQEMNSSDKKGAKARCVRP